MGQLLVKHRDNRSRGKNKLFQPYMGISAVSAAVSAISIKRSKDNYLSQVSCLYSENNIHQKDPPFCPPWKRRSSHSSGCSGGCVCENLGAQYGVRTRR